MISLRRGRSRFRAAFWLRLRQGPNLARRVLRHPDWLIENVRLLRRRRAAPRTRIDVEQMHQHIVDERTAITTVLGCSDAEYARVKDMFWAPARSGSEARAGWDARASLQSLLSLTVRLMRPEVMVETGVARGYSTAVALAAMDDVGTGRLCSIDLPALEYEGREEIGSAVPQRLRGRWDLQVGPSRVLLPRLAAQSAPIDIFLNDSDHTHDSQLVEYRTVWPHLRPGGILISDDVDNPAFVTFASEVGATPFLITDSDNRSAIGILAKPKTRRHQ